MPFHTQADPGRRGRKHRCDPGLGMVGSVVSMPHLTGWLGGWMEVWLVSRQVAE